jgi:hypothetical protein
MACRVLNILAARDVNDSVLAKVFIVKRTAHFKEILGF